MTNIAIVSGGYSDEWVISFKSAERIAANLSPQKYTYTHVRVLKTGWYAELNGQHIPIRRGDFTFEYQGRVHTFDLVVNTIHGHPGEDGFMQAYWDMIGQPYTGCGAYLSALTFNKRDCLAVLSKFGIAHAESVYLNAGDPIDRDAIVAKVGLPCFVKPNRAGSSLGISKVNKKDDLQSAIDVAFAQDNQILIERALVGKELSVGVMRFRGEVKVMGITEIVSHKEFFDYEAKYRGASDEITPAQISPEEWELLEQTAVKVYHSLNLSGITRSEFILENGAAYLLEINTLPGLSPQSIFPQQVAHAGIAFGEILENEIHEALKKDHP